jgi:transposase
MGTPIAQDIRRKAIDMYIKGVPLKVIVMDLGISVRSIYTWYWLLKKTGSLLPRTAGMKRRVSEEDLKRIKNY